MPFDFLLLVVKLPLKQKELITKLQFEATQLTSLFTSVYADLLKFVNNLEFSNSSEMANSFLVKNKTSCIKKGTILKCNNNNCFS